MGYQMKLKRRINETLLLTRWLYFRLLSSYESADEPILHLRCNRICIKPTGPQKLSRVVDLVDPSCFDVY
jgi:hypothetical protein